ncbi:MAG: ABC transporter substrate-binding protein [Acidobacteria bacterium]|nr:ABC transporter substrate-binding protein [Acidobacteriota bacterium]
MKLRTFFYGMGIGALVIAAAAMGWTFLAGPGAREGGRAGQKVVISALMHVDITGAWHELVARFNEENPDVEMHYIEGPWSTDTREALYTTSFLAGESPYDMVFMDVIWVPKFAAAGWLEDLTDWLPPEQWKEFLPGDLEGSKHQGRIYRVPMYSDVGMLFYRRDLLEAAGLEPPTTWQDLIVMAQKLQKPPQLWGYVWQGKQYEGLSCNLLEVLQGFGGSWVDPVTQEVGLDQPEAAAALQLMHDLIHKHKISPPGVTTYQEEEARQIFQSGNAVFQRNWPYAWVLAHQEQSPVKGKVGMAPMVSQKGQDGSGAQGGSGFGIYKYSKHKRAAWRFIVFATSSRAQKFLHLQEGRIPTRHALFRDPDLLEKSPHLSTVYQAFQNTALRPPLPNYAQLSDIVQRHASAALTGKVPVREALRRASAETGYVVARAAEAKPGQ